MKISIMAEANSALTYSNHIFHRKMEAARLLTANVPYVPRAFCRLLFCHINFDVFTSDVLTSVPALMYF